MRDSSGCHSMSQANSAKNKRLGGYLVEAGLLTPAQVDVALNDQQMTGMRFGEILAARGWVKQQTIEYLMQKVIIPEQESVVRAREADQNRQKKPAVPANAGTANVSAMKYPQAVEPRSLHRRDIPISKPLPAHGQADGEVSWVG